MDRVGNYQFHPYWDHLLAAQPSLDQALAAVRPAGAGAFGAPEAVAGPDIASPPTVGFDPLTGRPTVAWAARQNGVDPSMGVGRTAVLRFATREAP